MTTVAVLQARTSSSRMPGKVLQPILGEPMLFRQIERIRRARHIDLLLVATSTDPSDDAIDVGCSVRGVSCARGSLDDVLGRFVGAALPLQPAVVVRLTGDCPLADPTLIDAMLEHFATGGLDYLSNVSPPTFPDGLDVEIMRFECLLAAHREARLPSEREHVTPFLRAHPERFKIGNFVSPVDLSAMRWTVDAPEDLKFVRTVYERLYGRKPDFSTEDVLDLLRAEPGMPLINSRLERNEGFRKSLGADEAFLEGRK